MAAAMESSEMIFSEVPSVKMVIASPNDYPAAIIGAEVTVVGAKVRAKVRSRTNARSIIVPSAATQQKNHNRVAGQKKLSACIHNINITRS